jgi:hypothetical protein
MEHWASLIQTFLWVGLTGGIVIWARKPLHGILTALHKRIEGGSDVTAGPFSVKDLKPQPPDQQREKAMAELIAAPTEPEQLPAPEKQPAPQHATEPAGDSKPVEVTQQATAKLNDVAKQLDETRKTLDRITANTSQAQAYLAEDLALRTIQADFNVLVQRQATGGRDRGFDGVFETNGQVHIIEVKYIGKKANPVEAAERIKQSLQRLQREASGYGWSSSQFILAAVFASVEIPAPHREAIEAMCRELGRVTPLFYTLGKLKRQWGMDAVDWDDKIYR